MSLKKNNKNTTNKTATPPKNPVTAQPLEALQVKITFQDIKMYLDAIADNANLAVDNNPSCPHARFWSVSYDKFMKGFINNVHATPPAPILCNGEPIPIFNHDDPINSPFYLILKGPFCKKKQMPDGGPLLTDTKPIYQVTLSDGTDITGKEILDNIGTWLTTNFPEN